MDQLTQVVPEANLIGDEAEKLMQEYLRHFCPPGNQEPKEFKKLSRYEELPHVSWTNSTEA